MPTISVIVPVYKVEPYLRRCVDSILNQTFTDFELILVDDGSPDGCPAICDEYAARDSRVHVIHQENGGLSAARNAGIDWAFANSDSQWLSFIDSDDWIHPQFLEVLLNTPTGFLTRIRACKIEESSEVCSYASVLDASVSVLHISMYYQSGNNSVSACNKIYEKKLFDNVRYPVGKLNEDAFVTYKLLWAAQNVGLLDVSMYYYYSRPDSIMHSVYSPRRMDEIEAWKQQVVFFREKGSYACERFAAERYLHVCTDGIYGLAKLPENRRYVPALQSVLRKALREYAKTLKMTKASHPWIFEAAYPTEMKCYWYYQAFINKVKRIFSKD